ncbi:hypothetical protein [Cohnella zeiphila]|nr:hypothetical protein [Cohnella zeiphila]
MDRMYEHLKERFPAVALVADREESDNRYYQGINFKINVNA